MCMRVRVLRNLTTLLVKKHPDADSLYVEVGSDCTDPLSWLK